MMSTEQIVRMSDEAAADAERRNRQPWVPGTYRAERLDDLRVVARSMPNMGNYRPTSWALVERDELVRPAGMRHSRLSGLAAREPYLMVDASGLGAPDEPALTFDELVDLMAANPKLGYAIVETGQFQVVVGVFRKVDPLTRDQSEDRARWADTAGVAEAFVNGRAAKCHNADTDGRRYRLHATDIATKQPDGTVVFDWGGFYTPTTARHMNAILKAMGSSHRVSVAAARKQSELGGTSFVASSSH